MKSYLVLLFAFITALSVYGNDEDNSHNRGTYFSVAIFPWGYLHSKAIPLNAKAYPGVAVGHALHSTRSGFRYQAGLKWMKITFGESRYRYLLHPDDLTELGIKQMSSLEGSVTDIGMAVGPVGSLYYDHNIGEEEWFYLGVGLGLMKTDLGFELDIPDFVAKRNSDSSWTRMNQVELGVVWEVTENIDFQVGYEWMHIDGMNFDNVDDTGLPLSTEPFVRHMVKIGILHFFKRQ